MSQLENLMRRHKFLTERSLSTLYQPPSSHRFWRKSAKLLEKSGRKIPVLAAGGVLISEVSKQMNAPVGPGLRVTKKQPLSVLDGIRGGVPEPAQGRSRPSS